MTIVQQQFLELLKAGLWNRPADISLFQGKVDWQGIFKFAKQQAVQIHVTDGINTLPKEITPEAELIYKITIRRVTNSRNHELLNYTINKVTNLFNAEGIPSILLKGQGIAQNYINPTSRMCGDIDIYVGIENFNKACEILFREGAKDLAIQSKHDFHIALSLDGSTIEIHKKSDVISRKKLDKSLQKWIKSHLDAKLADGTLPKWDNEGTPINIPDPTYNAFYIIHHAVRHLVSEGLGLRHVCDWVRFIHTHHDQIDVEELKAKLDEYKMVRAWELLGTIATEFLDLPKEELILPPTQKNTAKAEQLLQHIFKSGNFGRYSSEKRDSKSHYLKRKWHNFSFQVSRIIKLYPILPEYTIIFGWGWFTRAIYRFFTKN